MNLKSTITGLLVGMALVPTAFTEARTDMLSAHAGRPYNIESWSSFGDAATFSGVSHRFGPGSPPKDWFVAFPNRWGSGTRTFKVKGRPPNVPAVEPAIQCLAQVLSSDALVWESATVGITAGNFGNPVLGSRATQATDVFRFICLVSPGSARLYSVEVI